MSNLIMDINIKSLLLYIFIILLLYCVMYIFIYNDKVFKFDNDDDNYNNYNNYNNKDNNNDDDNDKYNDKFINILNTEGDQYLNQLNNLSISTLNMRDNDIKTITDIINNIKQNQDSNNKKIIDSLTEIYFKRCLEYVNNKNAVVYNEFLKYDKPSENKYYQQFL